MPTRELRKHELVCVHVLLWAIRWAFVPWPFALVAVTAAASGVYFWALGAWWWVVVSAFAAFEFAMMAYVSRRVRHEITKGLSWTSPPAGRSSNGCSAR